MGGKRDGDESTGSEGEEAANKENAAAPVGASQVWQKAKELGAAIKEAALGPPIPTGDKAAPSKERGMSKSRKGSHGKERSRSSGGARSRGHHHKRKGSRHSGGRHASNGSRGASHSAGSRGSNGAAVGSAGERGFKTPKSHTSRSKGYRGAEAAMRSRDHKKSGEEGYRSPKRRGRSSGDPATGDPRFRSNESAQRVKEVKAKSEERARRREMQRAEAPTSAKSTQSRGHRDKSGRSADTSRSRSRSASPDGNAGPAPVAAGDDGGKGRGAGDVSNNDDLDYVGKMQEKNAQMSEKEFLKAFRKRQKEKKKERAAAVKEMKELPPEERWLRQVTMGLPVEVSEDPTYNPGSYRSHGGESFFLAEDLADERNTAA